KNSNPIEIEIAHMLTRVIVFGTIVAFVTWGSRQALRLWAVQQALLIDAQERVGGLSLFAALKGAGGLTRQDITTVTSALVGRPKSAPITEAAPPIAPVEAIAKILSKLGKDKS